MLPQYLWIYSGAALNQMLPFNCHSKGRIPGLLHTIGMANAILLTKAYPTFAAAATLKVTLVNPLTTAPKRKRLRHIQHVKWHGRRSTSCWCCCCCCYCCRCWVVGCWLLVVGCGCLFVVVVPWNDLRDSCSFHPCAQLGACWSSTMTISSTPSTSCPWNFYCRMKFNMCNLQPCFQWWW